MMDCFTRPSIGHCCTMFLCYLDNMVGHLGKCAHHMTLLSLVLVFPGAMARAMKEERIKICYLYLEQPIEHFFMGYSTLSNFCDKSWFLRNTFVTTLTLPKGHNKPSFWASGQLFYISTPTPGKPGHYTMIVI